ncbi:MAG: PEGA domain-containing protein [Candidatus Omnitrophica bacterium]|nr:PEGA domain-containing protein [Candidatus Omnitrophota bacterium]
MQEKYYSLLRRISFWLFSLAFVILTPVIVYYSLGYKFDIKSKKFLKTGALSIKTFPRAITVYLDGRKIDELTPSTIRELMPRKYDLVLEKEGFYSYRMEIEIRPSLVNNVDVFLIPKIRGIEKIKFNFNIYKFFVIKQIFTEKILVFTDRGIYFLDPYWEGAKKISKQVFTEALANSIQGVIENNNKLIFWNSKNVWIVDASNGKTLDANIASLFYTAERNIKDVFLGLKDRYVIVNDGLKVIVLDMDNLGVSFEIYTLNNANSKIFYDTRSETLYIRDKLPQTDTFSLFKIEIMPLIGERLSDERRKD